MILEYLLTDSEEKASEEKERIEPLVPKGFKIQYQTTVRGKCTYVQISHPNENEDTARKLSALNDKILSQFNVLTLKNECATYFTGRLYPIISIFECKLRKLLYLASADNPSNPVKSNISDLEEKDFGQLFELLFVDGEFYKSVKEGINKRDRKEFSKADVLAFIDELAENTNWDKLLGKSAAPTFRTRFMDVKRFRNDVMHTHYIGWVQYSEAKKLFTTINNELDRILEGILGDVDAPKIDESFNQALANALHEQKLAEDYADRFAKAVQPSIQSLDMLKGSIPNEALLNKAIELNDIYSPAIQQQYNKLFELTQKSQSPDVFEQLKKMERIFEANAEQIKSAPNLLQQMATAWENVQKMPLSPLLERLEQMQRFFEANSAKLPQMGIANISDLQEIEEKSDDLPGNEPEAETQEEKTETS